MPKMSAYVTFVQSVNMHYKCKILKIFFSRDKRKQIITIFGGIKLGASLKKQINHYSDLRICVKTISCPNIKIIFHLKMQCGEVNKQVLE